MGSERSRELMAEDCVPQHPIAAVESALHEPLTKYLAETG